MKTFSLITLTTFAALTISGSTALAEQPRYTCKAGALTITSTSPCYVTSYRISVPGDKGFDQESNKGGDAGSKKGGGLNGPKDLKDKPKGGGFNGPKNIKDKD